MPCTDTTANKLPLLVILSGYYSDSNYTGIFSHKML